MSSSISTGTAGGAQRGGEAEYRPVRAGETLESIAGQYGASAEQVWNDPLNRQVHDRHRGDPSGLAPGDALYIRQTGLAQPQPVGQGDYVVREGDCISSIARDQGHFWETIWNDPANAELKRVRKNPNVLMVGDRLTIRERRPKQEPGAAEARHRFVRRGEPSILRLKLLDNDQPLANLPYRLIVDGRERTGTTDAEGKVEADISGNARRAELYVGEGNDERYYELQLGELLPADTPHGLMARLRNLGYECDESGRELGPLTQESLRMFQQRRGLSETGQPDEDTLNKLRDAHEEGQIPPASAAQTQAQSGGVWQVEEVTDDDPSTEWGEGVEAVDADGSTGPPPGWDQASATEEEGTPGSTGAGGSPG